jgi:hypothetical protein
MSAIGWRRALPVVLLFGCGPVIPPERLFDMAIDCRPETAPVLATVEEAVAVLDADGDGALTDADLGPGEATMVLGLTGTHIETGEVSDPGFTIHTDWEASIFAYRVGNWGIQVGCNCLPMLNVFVNIGDGTLPGEVLTEGEFEGRGIGLDVVELEMHAADTTMDGTVHVTDVEGDRASGFLIGSGSSAFQRLIPDGALTGQRLSVEAFAFRDILNEEAD